MLARPALSRPALLIVEDEPISARFMLDALAELADCQASESMEHALQLAGSTRFNLAIVDCELADGAALTKLPHLICLLEAPGKICMTSAEWSETKRAAHLSQGASDCLSKPLSARLLRQRVQALIECSAPLPSVWNDADALARLGNNPIQLQALRAMLLQELPSQLDRLRSAREQDAKRTIESELHRLRAACGFCGAEALGVAIEKWSRDKSAPAFEALLIAAEAVVRQGANAGHR